VPIDLTPCDASTSPSFLTGGSVNPNNFGQVTGTFRNQTLTVTLGVNEPAHTVTFHGHIGSDTISGTFGAAKRKDNTSTAHATFRVTR
jgi:hypothetical protein